jgi:hypothetical protein
MWLQQEYQKGSFKVTYLETVSMLADGLTKYLPAQKFDYFKKLLNLKEIDHAELESHKLKEHKEEGNELV